MGRRRASPPSRLRTNSALMRPTAGSSSGGGFACAGSASAGQGSARAQSPLRGRGCAAGGGRGGAPWADLHASAAFAAAFAAMRRACARPHKLCFVMQVLLSGFSALHARDKLQGSMVPAERLKERKVLKYQIVRHALAERKDAHEA